MRTLVIRLFGVLFVLSLLFAPQRAVSFEGEDNSKEYALLIETYKEWLELEGSVFKKLSFKLSSSQMVKTGFNAKFIIEDNIGRKWLFKPDFLDYKSIGRIKGKVSVLVYRLYKLFGLESPQIHFLTLNINDEEISGSLQEFVDSAGNLSLIPPKKLGPKAIDYLLKSHVIDWLLANYDAGADNFLAISFGDGNRVEKIMRIDNEGAFLLLNKDKLKHDWKTVDSKSDPIKYYNRFWENYLHNKIRPKINENFSFIKFVSDFPDEFFYKLFFLNSDYDLTQIYPDRIKGLNTEYKEDLKYIIKRKHSLVEDFKQFYDDLAKVKKDPLIFQKNISSSEIIISVSNELSQQLNMLKMDEKKLNQAGHYPDRISAVFSFEGFICLKNVYQEYWQNGKKNLLAVCGAALDQIKLLKTAVSNKNQLRAINIYEQEILRIRSGNEPTFVRQEINKLIVNSILP